MSMYASAMMSVADALTGASAAAAYDEAYGIGSRKVAGMLNASRAKVNAEARIAAALQQKNANDVQIQMNQMEAEADRKVAQAVTGAEGGSADAVLAQHGTNAAFAKANNKAKYEQTLENELANVYSAQQAFLSVDGLKPPKVSTGMSIFGSLAETATGFQSMSIAQGGISDEDVDGFKKLFGFGKDKE